MLKVDAFLRKTFYVITFIGVDFFFASAEKMRFKFDAVKKSSRRFENHLQFSLRNKNKSENLQVVFRND